MSDLQLIPFEVTLKTNQTALVRDVGPEDRHLLDIGFHHLSDKSRHFRFLSAHPKLSQSEITHFTALNSPDHVAIGAIAHGESEAVPLGIARYVRLSSSTNVAEVAVTIVDSHQGIGLGSLLLGALAKYATINDISEFFALVLHENTAMLSLFKELGCRQIKMDGPEVEISVPLFSDPAEYPKTAVGDAFRAAYRLARFR